MSDLRAAFVIAFGTLWRRRVSLLAFALGAGAFQWLTAVSFPAIGGLEAVTSVLGTFPEGLRTLLKVAPNLQAGFGLVDYLAFTWIHPFYLGLGAAFVVSRTADALAGEVETGAIYLILSRPIARWTLVAGKMLELVLGAAVFVALSWAGALLGAWMARVGPLPAADFARVARMAWLLLAALGGWGMIVSSLTSRAPTAGGITTAVTLITFVLDVIPFIANSAVAWINPWHHYFPQAIVAAGQIDWFGAAVLPAWAIGGTVVAAVIFERRDLA